MKTFNRIVVALLAAMLLTACEVKPVYRGMIVLGEQQVLADGDVLVGDLLILDGSVHIRAGAGVDGEIYLIAGELLLEGEVQGGLSILSGSVYLGDTARISGDVLSSGGKLERSEAAVILGEVQSGMTLPADLSRPTTTWLDQVRQRLVQTALLALIALALGAFLPKPLTRIEGAVYRYPLIAFAVGFFSALIAVVLLVQMAFTLILAPLTALGLLLALLIAIYGWVAVGAGLLARLLPRGSSAMGPRSRVVVGVVFLNLIAIGLEFIPFIGPLIPLGVATAGIGAVLLTRLGLRAFVPIQDDQIL